jgi:long-chain acyl-CoA synthetase
MVERNLGSYTKNAVDRYADSLFLHIRRGYRTEQYTYAEMWSRSLKFRTYLLEKGIKKGDVILIWAPNMPEWVIALMGALVSGVVVSPISMHSSAETAGEYITQTEGKLLLKSRFVAEDLKVSVDTEILEELPGIIGNYKETPPAAVSPDDLAVIMYTSGTTGDPSGVMLSHMNILVGIEGLKRLIPPSREYRLLSIMPLSHALELLLGLFAVLDFGASLYYVPKVNPIALARALKKYRITHLILVPQLLKVLWNAIEYRVSEEGKDGMFRRALAAAPFLPVFLRRRMFKEIHDSFGGELRMFGCAGAPLDKEVAQNWEKIGMVVLEGYGLTETSAAVTANTISDRCLGSVGKLMDDVEVKFTKDGEILVRGPNVTKGYFKNEEKTKNSFTKEGFFKTGDVGYVADDGFVYLSGRKKFKIVISTGEKVYPEDVERKLNEHPVVDESCVVGIDKGNGEIVYAAVILKDNIPVKDVISQVNSELESHQVILEYAVWPEDDFPRTRTLKKDRTAVREWAMGRIGLAGAKSDKDAPEEHKTVDTLSNIISKVCDVPLSSVGEGSSLVTDFDIDSLKRVALVSMIEDEFGVEVAEGEIGESTTVKDLRSLISKAPKVSTDLTHVRWPLAKSTVVMREFTRRWVLFPLYRTIAPPVRMAGEDPGEILTEPGMIIFNHVGHNEPAMIIRALPPRVRKKLVAVADPRSFRNRFRSFLMYFVGAAFPVQKFGGPVRHTLELVADLLEEGWYVMMAPEGQRSEDGELQEFQRGTAVLAVETGVPVYPVKVSGYRDVYSKPGKDFDIPSGRGQITLTFGKPVRFDGDATYDEANDRLRNAIGSL